MNKKIFLYIVIGIIILALVVLTFFPGMIYALKDSGNTDGDICTPPSGYTEESWRTHMSHHPDIYKDCLN